jgi:hypothetical protein
MDTKELLVLKKEIKQRILLKEEKLLQSGYTPKDLELIREAIKYIAQPLLDEYYPYKKNIRFFEDS